MTLQTSTKPFSWNSILCWVLKEKFRNAELWPMASATCSGACRVIAGYPRLVANVTVPSLRAPFSFLPTPFASRLAVLRMMPSMPHEKVPTSVTGTPEYHNADMPRPSAHISQCEYSQSCAKPEVWPKLSPHACPRNYLTNLNSDLLAGA